MNIALISFTVRGQKTAGGISRILKEEGHVVDEAVKGESFSDTLSFSVSEWARRGFQEQDALIFVGAAGIAVRAISACIRSKEEDPAVLVIDEEGTYCIPLLSGHIGGANALALDISRRLPAIPVITTATDIREEWAVDVFAMKNRLVIESMGKAKRISAEILSGKRLRLLLEEDALVFKENTFSSLEVRRAGEEGETEPPDIYVGYDLRRVSEKTLSLIPRAVTAGIGCRKGISEEEIRRAVERAFEDAGIFPESLAQIASIDLKSEEKGLRGYCESRRLPFLACSAEKLRRAEGSFSGSAFVEQVTGVDNVCERSALLASGGRLLAGKQIYGKVTVALAVQEWSVSFE